MFGQHKSPFFLEGEGISISVEQKEDILVYQRDCSGEKAEKLLLAEQGEILVNPIEPLQTPKELTEFLMVEFDKKVLAEPKTSRKIYLTFPIEIGVFVIGKKEHEIIDIMSLARKKFTLYGDQRNGVICKYWHCDVYTSIPDTNYLQEGVLELTVTNHTDDWIELKKAVFNAYGMKIYYNDKKVTIRAIMKITTVSTAETDFIDSPLEEEENMEKSIELYTVKTLPIKTKKFVMREGL